MNIVIVKSKRGLYGYCPQAALPILGRILEYSDDGFATEAEARAAIKRDATIPAGARIIVNNGGQQ